MTTGPYWDVSNPKKPVGPLDVDEKLDIPWDWSDVLEDIASIIQSHTMVPSEPLTVLQSTTIEEDTKVLARIAVDPGTYDAAIHLNKKFGVTCHMVAADGQEFDKTLYFKIVEH